MIRRPTNRVRLTLIGIGVLLTTVLVLPSVSAQFPRPGGFPGGRQNIPQQSDPRMPNFPQPRGPQPTFPQPRMPDAPPPPGGGFGFEQVWSCSNCGKEIGRGAFPPDTCPHCGRRIINGVGNGDRPADNTGGLNSGPIDPPAARRGDFNQRNIQPMPPEPPPTKTGLEYLDNPDNWEPDHLREQGRSEKEKQKEVAAAKGMFWTMFGIIGGLGVLLVVGLVLFAILSQSGKKKPSRRRPRRPAPRRTYRDDDDDDEDDDDFPRSRRRRYD